MRIRHSKGCICAALTLALGVASVRGQETADKGGGDSQAAAGESSAEQWPSTGGILEQLFGPAETSGGDASASAGWTVGLGAGNYILSRRTQELMDMRRNWVFMDMNDLYPAGSPEGLSSLPEYGLDGKEKRSVSLLSKYYDSLDRSGGAGSDGKASGIAAGFNLPGVPVPGSDSFFKSILSPGGPSPSDKAGEGFIDPAFSAAAAQQSKEQQVRVDAFKHLLDPRLPLTPANSENALYGLSDPFRSAQASTAVTAPTAAPAQLNRSSLSGVAGMTDPLHPHYLDDPTARALGLNPAPAQAAPQQSITLRQLLDPSVGRPKRNF